MWVNSPMGHPAALAGVEGPLPPSPISKLFFIHRYTRLKFVRHIVHTKWNTMVVADNDKGRKVALAWGRRPHFCPPQVLAYRLPTWQNQGYLKKKKKKSQYALESTYECH